MVIGVAVPATCSLVSHNFCLVVSQLPAQVSAHRNRFTSRTDKASHAIYQLPIQDAHLFLSLFPPVSLYLRQT